jgi:hypothetical protein
MSTINGIEYSELLASAAGSRQGGIDSRTRIFLIAWDDLTDFLLGLYGYVLKTGTTYERHLPIPFAPGSALYAKSHTLEGLKCDGVDAHGNIHYAHARLVVTYAPIDQQDTEVDEPWVSIAVRARTELMPIPGWGLKWASDNVKLDQDMVGAYALGFETVTLARYNVADVNEAALSGYMGCVNAAIFRGNLPRTAMFVGWGSQRSVNTDGETDSYTLTIDISIRSVPWDYLWRPGAGWRQVKHADGDLLFTPADFSAIGITI